MHHLILGVRICMFMDRCLIVLVPGRERSRAAITTYYSCLCYYANMNTVNEAKAHGTCQVRRIYIGARSNLTDSYPLISIILSCQKKIYTNYYSKPIIFFVTLSSSRLNNCCLVLVPCIQAWYTNSPSTPYLKIYRTSAHA